ncbi:hypothetical protein GYH30_051528 [Glycine max]|uniref:Protein HEADING DATE 3A n=1 Tax=Glycine soja TaxID=3848 RepID=A0A445FZJ9_GLYSO|nr:hypothetical protein GYH30_051528 [Glycine max]RZB54329.1 Protein HEADING DATE 3A [Glycine soja]
MPGTTNPLVVERVIGDVLEPFASSIPLRVVYNKNKEVINIVEVGGDESGSSIYTLVMVDHDAPSPSDPNMREYLHRVSIDINIKHVQENVFTSSGWRQNYIMTRDFAYNLGLPVAAVYFNCQRQGGSGERRLML